MVDRKSEKPGSKAAADVTKKKKKKIFFSEEGQNFYRKDVHK